MALGMIGRWAEASLIQALKDKVIAKVNEDATETPPATETAAEDTMTAGVLASDQENGEEEDHAEDPTIEAEVQDLE